MKICEFRNLDIIFTHPHRTEGEEDSAEEHERSALQEDEERRCPIGQANSSAWKADAKAWEDYCTQSEECSLKHYLPKGDVLNCWIFMKIMSEN